MKNTISLIISVLICQSAGLIGSIFTGPAIPNWYANLNKPGFNPPSWVFAPAWLLLYTLMGIAAFLVWQKREEPLAKTALIIFAIHLIFNALWSVLFFGLKNPGLAFIEIIILFLLILTLIILFYKIDHCAAYLLIPYLLWVSFASILNYSIFRLN